MIDIADIYSHYYTPGAPITQLVWSHCRQVARLSVEVAQRCSQLHIDTVFLYEAAMLHDIGVFRTNAPSILCQGDAPYMQHGIIGAELLRAEGLPAHARVCETHIGVGLTAQEIVQQGLPLPHRDMLPVTLEEKLVCYADNFFSKSRPEVMRTYAQVRDAVARFGEENLQRFDELTQLFGKINE